MDCFEPRMTTTDIVTNVSFELTAEGCNEYVEVSVSEPFASFTYDDDIDK